MIFVILESFDGGWRSENGDQQIRCQVTGDSLECTWPDQSIETYQIEQQSLKGTTNQQICGYPSKDRQMITWNTGNRWFKEGNYFGVFGYFEVNQISYNISELLRYNK